MHAKDDRYAKFFLFTEKELEIFCDSQNQVCDHRLVHISLID